MFGEIGRIT